MLHVNPRTTDVVPAAVLQRGETLATNGLAIVAHARHFVGDATFHGSRAAASPTLPGDAINQKT